MVCKCITRKKLLLLCATLTTVSLACPSYADLKPMTEYLKPEESNQFSEFNQMIRERAGAKEEQPQQQSQQNGQQNSDYGKISLSGPQSGMNINDRLKYEEAKQKQHQEDLARRFTSELRTALSSYFNEDNAAASLIFKKMIMENTPNPIPYELYEYMLECGKGATDEQPTNLYKLKYQFCLNAPDGKLYYEAIAPFVREYADGDSLRAKTLLGMMLYEGRGVMRDRLMGVDYLAEAGNHGEPVAQYYLGAASLDGSVIKRDVGNAMQWLASSSFNGYVPATYTLALLSFEGKEVKRNEETGKLWLAKCGDYYKAHALIAKYSEDNLHGFRDDAGAVLSHYEAAANAYDIAALTKTIELYQADLKSKRGSHARRSTVAQADAQKEMKLAKYRKMYASIVEDTHVAERKQRLNSPSTPVTPGNLPGGQPPLPEVKP